MRPFTPGPTVINHTVTASSVAVSLGAASDNQQVRLVNRASAEVLVKFGDSTVTATTDSMAYPAGCVEVLTIPQGATHIAVIGTASSGKFQITVGVGI